MTPSEFTICIPIPSAESLHTWQTTGYLERRTALLTKIADPYANRIFLSHDNRDAAIAESLGFGWVCLNQQSEAAARINREYAGGIVIRTIQHSSGADAMGLLHRLRSRGRDVRLIARGGFLWSRFEAIDHGNDSTQARAAARAEAELARYADFIIGTSPAMVGDFAWRNGVEKSRCLVVRNDVGPDLPFAPASERERLSFLAVGPLIPRSRFPTLIDAAVLVQESVGEPVRLTLVGDGPHYDALKWQAENSGLALDIQRSPTHGQVIQLMARSTVFLNASSIASHPQSLIEAQATGATCIVAASPGLGGCVVHGVSGLVVPSEASAFAETIAGVLADDSWCESIGTFASQSVRSQFATDEIAKQELLAHAMVLDTPQRQAA